MMTMEFQFPIPEVIEGPAATKRYLSQVGQHLEDRLRGEIDSEFEISASPVEVDFGGYLEKCISIRKDGELRATFSLEWNTLSPNREFRIACDRLRPRDSMVPVRIAASLLVGGVSALWVNPLVGSIAFLAVWVAARRMRSADLAPSESLGLSDALMGRTAEVLKAF